MRLHLRRVVRLEGLAAAAALDSMTVDEMKAALAELVGVTVEQLPPFDAPIDAETEALLCRLYAHAGLATPAATAIDALRATQSGARGAR